MSDSTTDIKELYGIFGQAVIDQVQLEINRHGDLNKLLERLDEKQTDIIDRQHDILRKVITRYGPLFFLTVAKSDWSREQIQKMKQNVKAGLDTPIPGTHRKLGPIPPSKRVATPKPTEPRRIYPSDRKQIVQPRSPYSAPSRANLDHMNRRREDMAYRGPAATGPPAGPRAMIDVPSYRGPDRRVHADRRVGPTDRRASVALVYKNNRFGGRDRRKSVRRAADRDKNSIGGN